MSGMPSGMPKPAEAPAAFEHDDPLAFWVGFRNAVGITVVLWALVIAGFEVVGRLS